MCIPFPFRRSSLLCQLSRSLRKFDCKIMQLQVVGVSLFAVAAVCSCAAKHLSITENDMLND